MRLPHIPGEWIDRNVPLDFRFNGRSYSGFAGDCLGSALWAAQVRVLSRSARSRRRRGILSLAGHDASAPLRRDGDAQCWPDHVPLGAGPDCFETAPALAGLLPQRWLARLGAQLRAAWPQRTADAAEAPVCAAPGHHESLPLPSFAARTASTDAADRTDRTASNDSTDRTDSNERVDRTATAAVAAAVPAHVPAAREHCDVVVVGAGPSGLAAALAAAASGARVLLADENPRPGGSGLYQLGGDPARRAITRALIAQASTAPNIRLMMGRVAQQCQADHQLSLLADGVTLRVQARAIVVATGAYEQPAVFRNNDLPGVMLASAAQRLIYRYAVRPAERVVLLVANEDGYRCALDLLQGGADLAAVIDLRPQGKPTPLQLAVRARQVEILAACCVYEAHSGRNGCLSGVSCCPISPAGRVDLGQQRFINCDGLCMSVGWAPAAGLLVQAGVRMEYRPAIEQFVPDVLPPGIFAAGRANGVHTLDSKIEDGSRAGHEAAAFVGLAPPVRRATVLERSAPNHAWPIVAHPAGRSFIDWDSDVELGDVEAAIRSGCDQPAALWRHPRCAPGASQGRHSALTTLRMLARALGKSPGQIGYAEPAVPAGPPPVPPN